MKRQRRNEIDFKMVRTVILLVFVACAIAFNIFLLIKYGNKPVSEVPAWVFFLWSRR